MKSPTSPAAAKAARLESIAALPFIDVGTQPGFFRGTGRSLVEIWQHRELLGRLVKREIKAKYKDSSLGIVWSLGRPLVQLLIYYFAIGSIMGAARLTPDFGIFVFIGLTLWTLYSEIISGGVGSIINNAGLVKKVYLPREIFPLSTVGGALVNFGIQLVVLLLGIAVLSHYTLGVQLLLAPMAFIIVVVFATALGILASAVNVQLRDVQHFIEIYLLVFFWLSPIVYPFTFVHNAIGGSFLEELYLANPITVAIIAAQKALWSAGSEGSGATAQVWPEHLELRLAVALLLSLILLWVTQRIFARLQGNFAQEL